VSSIEKRVRDGHTRWLVRFRDPAGAQRARTFTKRRDAEQHLIGVESSKQSGSYVNPAGGRVTVQRLGGAVAGHQAGRETVQPGAVRRDHPPVD
jgi:hypothetical protein